MVLCSQWLRIRPEKKADSRHLREREGVIQSLITQTPPKTFWNYYDDIYDLMDEFDWVSMRWIPRERNKADRLFRI